MAKWRDLSDRIEAALPLDPATDAALAFVSEWFVLLEPFSRNATKSMWEGSARMYSDMDFLGRKSRSRLQQTGLGFHHLGGDSSA